MPLEPPPASRRTASASATSASSTAAPRRRRLRVDPALIDRQSIGARVESKRRGPLVLAAGSRAR
jgi:hypothetical protein